jgi:hypothetical protein
MTTRVPYNKALLAALLLGSVAVAVAAVPLRQGRIADRREDTLASEHIRRLINDYFQSRYESLKHGTPSNLEKLVDFDGHAVFARVISDLRDLELQTAMDRRLIYVDYDYSLSFGTTTFDAGSRTMSVSVDESTRVRFAQSPDVLSTATGIHHELLVVRTQAGWRIGDDKFSDDTLDGLKLRLESGESSETILRDIRADYEGSWVTSDEDTAPAVPKSGAFKPFNRDAAIAYAHAWVQNGAQLRNPAYANFENMGGDCTNYISQCIRAGGAPMDPGGNWQWYYNNINSRSPSWTSVNQLFSYLVNNTYTGPAGRQVANQNLIQRGDLVQLDTNNNLSAYEHSVLTVASTLDAQNNYHWLICCHSADREDYPLDCYMYPKRYIRITGYYD